MTWSVVTISREYTNKVYIHLLMKYRNCKQCYVKFDVNIPKYLFNDTVVYIFIK